MGGRVFQNPWWVVAGCALGLMASCGVVMSFTFSLFIEPIAEATGWSRSIISLGYSATVVTTALCSPLLGRVLDRLGAKVTLVAAVTLYALLTAMLGVIPAAPWAFLGFYALIGVFGAGNSPLPYAKVISAWFDRDRGLALGVAMAGIGVGGIVLPQIVRVLLAELDWRGAYVGLGVVILLIALPPILFLIREPGSSSAADIAARDALPGVSAAEALRDPRFWAIAGTVFLTGMALNGAAAHAVPLLTAHGLPRDAAGGMLAAFGLASLLGRVGTGYLLDRLFAPYVTAGAMLVSLLGVVLLWVGGSYAVLVAGVICLGASLGAEVDVIGYLASRYFGLRRFGEIYGYFAATFSLSSAAGAAIMGVSYDRAGSYGVALAIFAVALAVAVLLILRLGPYAFPPRTEPAAA